ncbi:MAG: DUF365 domain-containing protein [Pseudothermotoga sp.]
MNDIVGTIYPIPAGLAERLFRGNTKVFVKYVAHNTTRLAPKHKVIFYASHGSKKLIGEGIIEKVEFLTPQKVLEKYRDQLFLNEAELHTYVKRSPSRSSSKEMLTLVLKKLKKFPKPIDYNKPITMAGQYLSAEEYSSLIQK